MKKINEIEKLLQQIINCLDEIKAINTKVIDLQNKSSISEFLVICDGSSSRHVNSIVHKLSKQLKKNILSVEGIPQAEWALVDFGDIIVHVFKPELREHYNLEKLWSNSVPNDQQKFG
ncbi:MAG: ribosome silencing factor [Rickettsiales bacterium]|nr:ribosome silencing factor [Rickettsiales bacterium]OUV54549.1 MAG: ribosome silencing factor [Rickettsiales bacterium TMED127]|tara:strand:- start:30189 stop:30542 length:354 start_codon:yes stop_codon:yes gene_type:complete